MTKRACGGRFVPRRRALRARRPSERGDPRAWRLRFAVGGYSQLWRAAWGEHPRRAADDRLGASEPLGLRECRKSFGGGFVGGWRRAWARTPHPAHITTFACPGGQPASCADPGVRGQALHHLTSSPILISRAPHRSARPPPTDSAQASVLAGCTGGAPRGLAHRRRPPPRPYGSRRT